VRREVRLPGRRTACIRPVPLEPGVRQVQMLVHATGPQTRPLDITLRSPGYVGRGRFIGYPAGGPALVLATLDRAPPRDQDGELCIRNTGRRSVGLVGTNEPESQTLPVTYVGRRPPSDIDPAITFLSGRRVSILGDPGASLRRAAALTGVVPAWLMWPLGLLFLIGVPIAVAAALLLSAWEREEGG
jgi:hypothetical protein